jgi:hypothetical protein
MALGSSLRYSISESEFEGEEPSTCLLEDALKHNNRFESQKRFCSHTLNVIAWFLAFLFGTISLFLFLERSASSSKLCKSSFATEFGKLSPSSLQP